MRSTTRRPRPAGSRSESRGAKPVSMSRVQMTELVLPNDTNTLGNVLGGRVMHWIDMACAMAAQRHARRSVVTASMDRVHFHKPVRVGHQLIVSASVNAAWGSSMEVGARVESEDPKTGRREHTVSAYTTFVALDDNYKPVKVPRIRRETATDERRWKEAQKRREARLAERSAWKSEEKPKRRKK
jgi:acyl-CoA hydrolase